MNPDDTIVVMLTLEELAQSCAERALAKVGEIGMDAWNNQISLNMADGVLHSVVVRLTKRKRGS